MSALNDAFQAHLERTHCEQDWPCAMSGLAHELGDAYATLTEQVETLTADNAALYEVLSDVSSWIEDPRTADSLPTDFLTAMRNALKTDHLGAALLEELAGLRARVVTLEAEVRHLKEDYLRFNEDGEPERPDMWTLVEAGRLDELEQADAENLALWKVAEAAKELIGGLGVCGCTGGCGGFFGNIEEHPVASRHLFDALRAALRAAQEGAD